MQRNLAQGKLGPDYMEYVIFSLWKIDIKNYIKNKASLAKSFHIQPSEIDKMTMWEYELFMNQLNGIVEEENKLQEGQMRDAGIDPKNPGRSIGQYMNVTKNIQQPKMPSFNTGSFNSALKL